MTTIVTRAVKGSPLTNTELDSNFTNLKTTADAALPLSGGTLTGTLSLGDNVKAQFGAGSDLQIYHDGSDSYIDDAGTGRLWVRTNELRVQKYTGEAIIKGVADGAVTLYHNNAEKLASTSSGINITGSVVADGLTVDGNNDIQINRDGISSAKIFWNRSGTTDAKIELDASENLTIAVDEAQLGSKSLVFKNNNADGLLISSTQNVNIPNGGLMVGATTAPTELLEIAGSSDPTLLIRHNTADNASSGKISFRENAGGTTGVDLRYDGSANKFIIDTSDVANALTISRTTGNVNIPNGSLVVGATTAPSAKFQVDSGTASPITTISRSGSHSGISFSQTISNITGGGSDLITYSTGNDTGFAWQTTDSGGTQTRALTIAPNRSATFSSSVTVASNLLLSPDGSNDLIKSTGGVLYLKANELSVQNNSGVEFISTNSAGTVFNNGSADLDFRVESNNSSHALFVEGSSGNVLVGKSTANIGVVGQELRADGSNYFTSTNDTALGLNRLASDGTVLEIRRQNAIVGSIGVANGDLNINGDTGIRFQDTSIMPRRSGSDVDATVDIGLSSHRWKDLYLSGNATAQKLTLTKSPVGNYSIEVDGTSTGQPNFIVKQSTSERLRIDHLGRVGIGTSSFVDTNARLVVSNGTVDLEHYLQSSGGIGYFGTRTNHALGFTSNGSERMRIDNQGRVGIGNTSPDSVLTAVNAASTAALRIGLNNTSFNYMDADNNIFRSGSGTERMRIDSSGRLTVGISGASGFGTIETNTFTTTGQCILARTGGNVGIGTTSLGGGRRLTVSGGAIAVTGQNTSHSASSMILGQDSTALSQIRFYGANTSTAGVLQFTGSSSDGSAGGERFRCDHLGNLLVGTSSVNGVNGTTISNNGNITLNTSVTSGGAEYITFRINGTQVGSITTSGGNATDYNTSSDQRLKENIADADDSGSKVDAIQVRKFDWKADGSHQDYGMIAQELQAVAPEAVSVPEDKDEMMGVDYSKLVPMLIKEIQSLRQRVAQLEE